VNWNSDLSEHFGSIVRRRAGIRRVGTQKRDYETANCFMSDRLRRSLNVFDSQLSSQYKKWQEVNNGPNWMTINRDDNAEITHQS
jgi:hypothetical protein